MKRCLPHNGFCLTGEVGKLADNLTTHWLIGLRETNPAILDMFRERDTKPYRDLLPWSGEFAGKYLTGAHTIYCLNHNEALKTYVTGFIDELLTYVDDDGYIGCFQKECRLTGAYSQTPSVTGATWDAWTHYHILLGLLLWTDELKRVDWQTAIDKIAGLFLRTFYTGERRLVDIGSTEMNLAPLHIFALLYARTGDVRYRRFCEEILQDLSAPTAGDYINHSRRGLEYYQCPKPRWESLHIIQGIAAFGRATGDEALEQVAEQIFTSILHTDIHNTGGFSTDEQAVGNPYTNGNIELCCVIAYNALACDMLYRTGDSRIADFLELSLYNAILGSFSPTGRWSTYNTPMEGSKCANYHTIVFQSRPGSPDLNCCSANAARGVGMLSDWAVLQQDDTLYLNSYEACEMELDGGLSIRITGRYPLEPLLRIQLSSTGARRSKKLALRIPAWSENTSVLLAGQPIVAQAGTYLILEPVWDGEEIQLQLDFAPHFTEGGGDYTGKCSVYYGPILYGCDQSCNLELDFDRLPLLSRAELQHTRPVQRADGRWIVSLGNGVTLSDFYRLGVTGSRYTTWLDCR